MWTATACSIDSSPSMWNCEEVMDSTRSECLQSTPEVRQYWCSYLTEENFKSLEAKAVLFLHLVCEER